MIWCGLSRHQTDTALAELKSQDFIETGQHKFAGKTTILFTRPTQVGALFYRRRIAPDAFANLKPIRKPARGVKPETDPETDPETPITTLPLTYQELTHTACAEEPLGESALKCSEDDMAKLYGSVSEVIGSMKNPTPNVNEKHLSTLWRAAVLEVTDLAFIKLSDSEKSKLNKARDLMPKNMAGQIVYYTLKNWSFFAAKAKDAAGVYKSPELPEVFFFCKHVNIATNLYLHHLKAAETPAAAPKQAETVMTAAELEALTQDDDE